LRKPEPWEPTTTRSNAPAVAGAYLGARIADHDSSVGFHVQRALCGSKILGGFVLKGVGGLVGQRRIDRNGRAGYTAGCDRR